MRILQKFLDVLDITIRISVKNFLMSILVTISSTTVMSQIVRAIPELWVLPWIFMPFVFVILYKVMKRDGLF